MSTVEDIKQAIQHLPPNEYAELRHWLSASDWQNWDQQIEHDSAEGKLDFFEDESISNQSQIRYADNVSAINAAEAVFDEHPELFRKLAQ